jgi:hypothetical protein
MIDYDIDTITIEANSETNSFIIILFNSAVKNNPDHYQMWKDQLDSQINQPYFNN